MLDNNFFYTEWARHFPFRPGDRLPYRTGEGLRYFAWFFGGSNRMPAFHRPVLVAWNDKCSECFGTGITMYGAVKSWNVEILSELYCDRCKGSGSMAGALQIKRREDGARDAENAAWQRENQRSIEDERATRCPSCNGEGKKHKGGYRIFSSYEGTTYEVGEAPVQERTCWRCGGSGRRH
jgi:hypothetical protein